MDRLTADNFYFIFEYLPPNVLVKTVQLTCKRFRALLSNDYWKRRALQGRKIEPEFLSIFNFLCSSQNPPMRYNTFPEFYVVLKLFYSEVDQLSCHVLPRDICVFIAIYNDNQTVLEYILAIMMINTMLLQLLRIARLIKLGPLSAACGFCLKTADQGKSLAHPERVVGWHSGYLIGSRVAERAIR